MEVHAAVFRATSPSEAVKGGHWSLASGLQFQSLRPAQPAHAVHTCSALKPMPLPEDLKSVLGKFSVWNDVLQRAALGLVVVILMLALR